MRKGSRTRMTVMCVFAVLLMLSAAVGLAALPDAVWPSADGEIRQAGGLTLDVSHMNDGYIMAKGPETKKRLKLRVKVGDQSLDYDLEGDAEYDVIPLQMGNGEYSFTLYKNVSGKKYAQEGRVGLKVSMDDPNRAFLVPNYYVPYDQETEAVKMSEELCAGLGSHKEKYEAITKFVKTGFVYDFVKMVTVKAGTQPDIDACFEKRMGICQDLSAMTACMMRVQGIPAKMMIGNLSNGMYHAWVVAVVDGEEILFDPTAELNAVAKDLEYTIERFY